MYIIWNLIISQRQTYFSTLYDVICEKEKNTLQNLNPVFLMESFLPYHLKDFLIKLSNETFLQDFRAILNYQIQIT